ncbi:MAG: hypothetical protein D6B26_02745 [Spirochaetaceae bacterium]|nr:MAG: hypothetical protein D6B26_02745 [Spirochaetaceae bacterium]
MDPVGRLIRAILPGQKAQDIRPGAQLRASVIRPLSDSITNNYYLLQVGKQQLTAFSQLKLIPGQALTVMVEQGAEELLFRIIASSSQNDRLDSLLHALGVREDQDVFRTILESFVRLGIPLSEQYTLPAIQQFARILQDTPFMRGRYRELARLIAMFADRGMRVPDELLVKMIGGNHDENQQQEGQQQKDQRQKDQQKNQQKPSEKQDTLILPDLENESRCSDPGWQLLNATRGRQDEWLVIPFSYAAAGVFLDDAAKSAGLSGTIRLQNCGPRNVIIDVNGANSRYVFFWSGKDQDGLRVFYSGKIPPQSLLNSLTASLGDLFAMPESIQSIDCWDGFADVHEPVELTGVQTHG